MRPTCPQCKQAIEGAANHRVFNPSLRGTYVVGWCQRDVHEGCFALHVRSCSACRAHNDGLAAQSVTGAA